MKRLNCKGFGIIEGALLISLLVAVGAIGWYSYSKMQNNKESQGELSNNSEASSDVTWSWGGDKWATSGGSAPDCGDGPEFKMPVDLNKVTSVLYPGQTRGGNYKAHGGFLFGGSQQNEIDVVAPIDSHLTKASRYIEQGEVQYFMVFSVPCGFAYRFDHLQTLTPEFQAVMDKLPEPEVDNSRTTNISPAIKVKAGDKIATGVGFKTNTSVDFGVYDVRKPNDASKRSDFAKEHANFKEFDYYGVCFLNYFDSSTTSLLKALPGGDQSAGKTSDYCE